MGTAVKTMEYKEAWEKCNADYLSTTGAVYKYILDRYGEDDLIEFLEKEVIRYKEYYSSLTNTFATILEKLAPGMVFDKKIQEVGYEFQWFLGVDNMEITELDTEKGIGKLKFCPYEKAITADPKGLDIDREFYCKYQCNIYMRGFCKAVLGFDLTFEPQETGCVYNIERV